MINKVKRCFKRAYIASIRARQEKALYYAASQLTHEYPSGTSVEAIIADLRGKS